MKRFRIAVLALTLLITGHASAQDRASRTYTIPVGHIVTITWTASLTAGVTYNVYVSGTSGGPYTRVGNTAGLVFADIGATAGNTYFYVVTSMDSTGIESVFSNEVSAKIPTP